MKPSLGNPIPQNFFVTLLVPSQAAGGVALFLTTKEVDMTDQKPKHTPGKWIIEKLTNGEYMIRGGDAGRVRIGRIFDFEDAAFICRAVNNFDEMLEALKTMTGKFLAQITFSVKGGDQNVFDACLKEAQAIIAKAEGQPDHSDPRD